MSERDRGDRGAIVALGLLLSAILCLAALEASTRYRGAVQSTNRPTELGVGDRGNDQPAQPNSWPQFTPSDTYAQWIMAALALPATVISILGLVWIKQTLVETRSTARSAQISAKAAMDAVANERAWLLNTGAPTIGTVHNSTAYGVFIKDGLRFDLQWVNTGRTPAVNVNAVSSYKIVRMGDAVPVFDIPFEKEGIGGAVVPPSQGIHGSPVFLDDAETAAFRAQKIQLILYGKVSYRDVFASARDSAKIRYSEVCIHVSHSGGKLLVDGQMKDFIASQLWGDQQLAT